MWAPSRNRGLTGSDPDSESPGPYWPGQAAGDIVYGLWATVHGLAMLEQTVLRVLTDDAGPRQRATLEQVTRTLVAPSAGVS